MNESNHCPLCGGPAQVEWRDSGNCKAYSCPQCTDFFITVEAEKRLSAAPRQWREQASIQSRHGDDHRRLLITRLLSDRSETPAPAGLQWVWVSPRTLRPA